MSPLGATPPATVPSSFAPHGPTTGTNSTQAANLLGCGQIMVPWTTTITGVAFYNGGTVAGNVIVALYNAQGQLVAQSASTAQAGTFGVQRVAFTTPYVAQPGVYYVGLINSLATATFALRCATGPSYGVAQGSFALPASIGTGLTPGAYIPTMATY